MASAQYNFDFGGHIGAAAYLGEIGGEYEAKKYSPADIQFGGTRYTIGASARYFFTPTFAVSTHLLYGRVTGADSLSLEPTRVGRNLSFSTDIIELSARGELHFLKLYDLSRNYRYRTSFSMFAFGGVGGFFFNPKAEYRGEKYALQPLQTEGVSYSRLSMSFPIGIGANVRLQKKHIFGFEIGWRPTLTDYIDDVSTFYVSTPIKDPIRAALADRSGELSESNPAYAPQHYGQGSIDNPLFPAKRGNYKSVDSYIFATLTYSYAKRGKRTKFRRSKYRFIKRGKRSKARF